MQADLKRLEHEIYIEKDLQAKQMENLWSRALDQRIQDCRALGHLTIDLTTSGGRFIHFIPPKEDFAFFQNDQRVRLSLDSPTLDYYSARFVGITDKGLTVSCYDADLLIQTSHHSWSIDEDLVDMSSYYLSAIREMAEKAHGRDIVFPALFGEDQTELEFSTYEETKDGDGVDDLNEEQEEAVATALATIPFHLIKGPPGTGKTHALARIVRALVEKGDRVLVSGFTNRSINHALTKVHSLIGDSCPIVKIGNFQPSSHPPVYSEAASLTESGLEDGPYVVGATPFALYSKRLAGAHFDSAVIDETSQMTLPAAIMIMMKSDRWIFFGDDKQLPPVSLFHKNHLVEASVFYRLAQKSSPTLLEVTYRMNEQLTAWPSETFYGGALESDHSCANRRLALEQAPRHYDHLLSNEDSLVAYAIPSEDCKSSNNEEAEHAAQITLQLLTCGIAASEIGIITPFRAQAAKIRQLLAGGRFKPGFESAARTITVDTVDRFQGQERKVILYSFVSSDQEFMEMIQDFLFQPQRLNVAVTRAESKVILLASPQLRDFARVLSSQGSEAGSIAHSLFTAAHLIS